MNRTGAQVYTGDVQPVLVVDPDDRERARIVRALRRDSHQVLEARDGAGALALLEGRPCALVIVAEQTPPGPAQELVRRLRGKTRGPLVVIEREKPVTEREALTLGADHYERRPLHPALLAARVQAYLRRMPDQGSQHEPAAVKGRDAC